MSNFLLWISGFFIGIGLTTIVLQQRMIDYKIETYEKLSECQEVLIGKKKAD